MVFGLYDDDAVERIVSAAATVRVEASKRALNLVDHFLRFDPAAHGTLNGKVFYNMLRSFGLQADECDMLCRRFSANCTDWSCDYLDFCRCVELSDDAAVAAVVARLTHGLNSKSLREPFLEADVHTTGSIPVRTFRSIILYEWQADATELQLQLLASRFAHPCEANLVAYRPFLQFLDTDIVSPTRFRRLDRHKHYDDRRYWRDDKRSRFNSTSPLRSPLARYQSDLETTEPIPLLPNDKLRYMDLPKRKLHRESCGTWRGSACSPRHSGRRVTPVHGHHEDSDDDDGWRDCDGCVDHTTRKNPRRCGATFAPMSSRDDPVAADTLHGRSARGVRSAEELCVRVNGGRWVSHFRLLYVSDASTPQACAVCCNTENSRTSDSCFICVRKRLTQSSSMPSQGATNPHLRGTDVLLECPQCNFINPDSATTCDVCNFQLRPTKASRSPNSASMVQSADGWRTEAEVFEKKPSRWTVNKLPQRWQSRFSPEEKVASPRSPRIKELDFDD